MTLLPVESRDVKGVPATKYRVNRICSHPHCTAASEPGAHHIFRRSAIIGDSYFVSIDFADPIPHAVGLCSEHHRQITDNNCWIKLEDDGTFVWYEALPNAPVDPFGKTTWEPLAPLDPQPGQLEKRAPQKPARLKTEKTEEKRPSANWAIRCPKDAAAQYGGEDGIALLKEMVAECARLIPHRDEDSPPYFVLMDALGWFLLNYRPGEDG